MSIYAIISIFNLFEHILRDKSEIKKELKDKILERVLYIYKLITFFIE